MTLAAQAAAQRRPAARPGAATPVKVTLTVAGRTETLRGSGHCSHEPRGSIYGRPAALWTAEYAAGQTQRVALTYWRFAPAGANVGFSLSVQSGSAAHRINTVSGSRPEGSGRASFQPTALGGRFQISGRDQNGVPLQATIECARFDGVVAEGG